ncbi:MAG: alpha/beta hydrolase [Candidatus Taylorbacteria bacterium]|nr:alpha/beta hydrolase [Candidatus Taylorbacteria bacterium]
MKYGRIFVFSLVIFAFIFSVASAGDVLFETIMPWYYWWSDMSWGTGGFTYVSTVAIGYKPSTNQEVCTIKAGLYKSGSPADSVIMTVRGGGNGYPTGGNVMATVTIPGSQVASPPFLPQQSAYTAFTLSPCLNLIAGTNYTLVFNRTQPGSSGSYISQISSLIYYSQTKFWAYVPVNGFWQEKFPYTPALRLEGPDTKEPVIIVPGILGSRLNRVSDGEEVWPNGDNMAGSKSDNYLDELIFSADGQQISGYEMVTNGIIEKELGVTAYGNLIKTFEDMGYLHDQDLFTVAYDWRFSVQDSADILANVVQEALASSPTGKVNIIAHSMGGLVTKEYLSRLGVSGNVNNVVFLGIPNLGAPKTFKAINYGDNMGFSIGPFDVLNPLRVKTITQNMPGVYELLPSREYINLKGSYVRDFRNNQNINLSYDQTNSFMISDPDLPDHRNTSLLSGADQYHQTVDTQAINGPTVFNIMGCQNPDTIGEVRLYDDGNVDITAVDGDGTVPLISARANSDNYHNYYAPYSQIKADHSGLVKNGDITKFVADLITEINPTIPSGLSQSISNCLDALPNPTKVIFSTHSPVSLHVYDDQNRHTGLNVNGDFEADIPDSNFYMIGENSFASVLAGNQYRVVIDALSSGSFDFKIKSYNGSVLGNSAAYLNVSLPGELFRAEMNFISVNPDLELNIDNNGDDVTDEVKNPDVTLSNFGNEDPIPPSVTITEPILTAYARSTLLPIVADLSDADSGIGLVQKYFDGRLLNSDSVDLFFEKLGSHSIDIFVYDKAGNPSKAHKNILVIATVQSTISDIERIHTLGWTSGEVKHSLKSLLEASLPTAKTLESKGKKADGVLGTAFLNQLETEYNKGNINKQAYDLLKEDIGWLLK